MRKIFTNKDNGFSGAGPCTNLFYNQKQATFQIANDRLNNHKNFSIKIINDKANILNVGHLGLMLNFLKAQKNLNQEAYQNHYAKFFDHQEKIKFQLEFERKRDPSHPVQNFEPEMIGSIDILRKGGECVIENVNDYFVLQEIIERYLMKVQKHEENLKSQSKVENCDDSYASSSFYDNTRSKRSYNDLNLTNNNAFDEQNSNQLTSFKKIKDATNQENNAFTTPSVVDKVGISNRDAWAQKTKNSIIQSDSSYEIFNVCGNAKESENVYIGDQDENGQKTGDGIVKMKNGDEFVGRFFEGQKLSGRYTYKNGDVYIGQFVDDQFEGEAGRLILANGDMFQGRFEANQKDKGKYTYANGDVYIGDYVDDLCEGNGTFLYHFDPNFDYNGVVLVKYIGTFDVDNKIGQGVKYFKNGNEINGRYEKGIFVVNSSIYYFNDISDKRESFLGNFTDNGFYKGYLKYKNGNTYEGEFLDNRFNNFGSYKYKTPVDISQIIGYWSNGQLTNGSIYYTNKSHYIGDLLNKQYHGYGEFYYYNNKETNQESKKEYKGHWKNGTYTKGKLLYNTDNWYDGEFNENGQFHGYGEYFDANKDDSKSCKLFFVINKKQM